MPKKNTDAREPLTFMIEDADIRFKNFAGRPGKFDNGGNRSFLVALPFDVADKLAADGWRVTMLKSKDPEVEDTPCIRIAVKYNKYPTNVVMLSSRGRVHLDEGTIEVLDYSRFATVDLIARGYEWDVNGESGVKAYLQSMFVTIDEDPLELKYAQLDMLDE